MLGGTPCGVNPVIWRVNTRRKGIRKYIPESHLDAGEGLVGNLTMLRGVCMHAHERTLGSITRHQACQCRHSYSSFGVLVSGIRLTTRQRRVDSLARGRNCRCIHGFLARLRRRRS